MELSRLPPDLPAALRDDLIAFLMCDSADRARLIADLLKRNPGVGDLLADLDLRARVEIELLGGGHANLIR